MLLESCPCNRSSSIMHPSQQAHKHSTKMTSNYTTRSTTFEDSSNLEGQTHHSEASPKLFSGDQSQQPTFHAVYSLPYTSDAISPPERVQTRNEKEEGTGVEVVEICGTTEAAGNVRRSTSGSGRRKKSKREWLKRMDGCCWFVVSIVILALLIAFTMAVCLGKKS